MRKDYQATGPGVHGAPCFKTLLENAVEILEALDENGVYLYATPSLKQWLGYEPAELPGTDSRDLVHTEDRSLWADPGHWEVPAMPWHPCPFESDTRTDRGTTWSESSKP
jgi:PAS domain-containing protein